VAPFTLTVRGLVGSEGRAIRLATSLSSGLDDDQDAGTGGPTWSSHLEATDGASAWELLVGPGGTPGQAAEAVRLLVDPMIPHIEGSFRLEDRLCLLLRAMEAPPLESWVGRELPEAVVLEVIRSVGAMLVRLRARAVSLGLPPGRAMHGNLAASCIWLDAGGRLYVTRFRTVEALFVSEVEGTAGPWATGRLLAPEWGTCDEGEHTDVFCLAAVAFCLLAPPSLALRMNESLAAPREVDFNATWRRLLDDRSFRVRQELREMLAQALLYDPGMRPSAEGLADRARSCGASGEALVDFALADVPRLLRPRPGPHPWSGWRLELHPEEAASAPRIEGADPRIRRVAFQAFATRASEAGNERGIEEIPLEARRAMAASGEEPDTVFVQVDLSEAELPLGSEGDAEGPLRLRARPDAQNPEGARLRNEPEPRLADAGHPASGQGASGPEPGRFRDRRAPSLAVLGVLLVAAVVAGAWWTFTR
jgi:hypothetical protein